MNITPTIIKAELLKILENEAKDADLIVKLDELEFTENLSDLGFDSMNQMNILVELEDAFDVRFPEGEFTAIKLNDFIEFILKEAGE